MTVEKKEKLIKHVLWLRRMNQAELSRRTGIFPGTVSRLVRGLEPPYPNWAKRIADALGWEGDPMELFEEASLPDDEVEAALLGEEMGSWGKVRAPTGFRLADALAVQPVTTFRAWVSIATRARPYAKLGDADAQAVADWAAETGSPVSLGDYEVAAVSNKTVAEEAFNGDTRNARKGIEHLIDAGIIDKARSGTRGHASLYVTYPTRADVAEGVYGSMRVAVTGTSDREE